MVENDLQPTQAKGGYMANSAMASNHASAASAQRKNHHGKIRASHSQFSEDNVRQNTGYISQRNSNAVQGNSTAGFGPAIDSADP